jgi:metal-responsive CopG/Arc/MetJ family transcriptional regulator
MNKTRKRVNITLPPETLKLIDRVSKDNRSEFINKAVRLHVNRLERAKLKQRLKETYLERAKEDIAIAKEWQPIERELWEKLERGKRV